MITEGKLKEFVEQMKLKLDLNQEKKGDSWLTCDMGFLQRKLNEETEEYWDAEGDMRSARELVDVANICMMLYHRHFEIWARHTGKVMFEKERGQNNETIL